jgi:hypothetical protein
MSFGAAFLHRPERFPSPPQGAAWGGSASLLDLPGGPYWVSGLSRAQELALRATFPGARTGEAEPPAGAVAIAMRQCRADAFRRVDTRGWDYALDFDFAASVVRMAGLGLMACLDGVAPGLPESDLKLAGTLWTPADGGELFPGIFENFLRVLVAYRLLDSGGVVLHSAGLVKSGRGYLFLGRSGAGKTTVSRLGQEQGGEVLSDDLNALCPDALAGCVVLKLPFTGEIGDRRSGRLPVPLGGLLRLEKSVHDELLPLSRAQAVACMMACAPFVNADPWRRQRLEDALLALLGGGPARAFLLRFSLSAAFWSIID